MSPDGYMLFTQSHRLYVQGVRQAIRERLEAAFGEEWWEKGVERGLPPERLNALQTELQRIPDRDRHLLLDAGHFRWIISNHHKTAFSDSFRDSIRTFKELRYLSSLRNEWAHVQDISLARARQAADMMKQILASLRREEALEIEQMTDDIDLGTSNETVEDSGDDADYDGDSFDAQATAISPLDPWRQLQSYLLLEQSVEIPKDDAGSWARVMVKVHNTAPLSADWPTVYFDSVVVEALGQDSQHVGELGPGETQEVEFSFPVKQIMDVEFKVTGSIDAGRLCEFRQATSLPSEVVAPLQLEFANRLRSIGIREFVDSTLEAIGTPSPNMTLTDIARVREALRQQSSLISDKETALNELFREFHLSTSSKLGPRVSEIYSSLQEFGKNLDALDEAIGRTDLDLMSGVIHDLKQVQLAMLRLEGDIGITTPSGG